MLQLVVYLSNAHTAALDEKYATTVFLVGVCN